MPIELADADAGWIKLNVLAHGVEISPTLAALANSVQFAPRKNFYNTPLWYDIPSRIPQELRLLGLIVGLNAYGVSPWKLSCHDTGRLVLEHSLSGVTIHPELVGDLAVFERWSQASGLANLYGGAALAFFSPRACYFFTDGTQCGFCSLEGTASEHAQYSAVLTPDQVRTTVAAALAHDRSRIEQVMIVGGNMRDLNRGFRHHLALATAAQEALLGANEENSISIHIATMPPRDLGLISELKTIQNVHVMFNLEVWDPVRFEEICPGKAGDYGRSGMLAALECLRDTIGPYRAHSLLVTGLEPADTTLAGASALANIGISPIINIYHSDRHSRLGLGSRPSFEALADIALGLQSLYDTFPLKPYWRNCGRNSIDAEASRGLFRERVPDFIANARR
jgi:hypothetical protein